MPWQNTILLFVFVIFVLSVSFRTANVKCDLQCVFSFFFLCFVRVRKRERHHSVSNARNSIRRADRSEEYLNGRGGPRDARGIHHEQRKSKGKPRAFALRIANGVEQPRARKGPIGLDSRNGQIECLGDFLVRHAPEIPKLYDLGLEGILQRKFLQRVVHGQ